MAQPTQLTPTEQDALVKQIGLAMLRVAPDDWEQLAVDYRAVGRYSEATGMVAYTDGSTEPWTMPQDLQGLFARLRGGMYREGRGTWFNARYRLDHPSSYNLEYDREEPGWDLPPPPQAYPDDMRMFPRSDDNVPAWLRRRLTAAPPPARFRVARIFDGPGAGVNRPPVPPDDVRDLLAYLDSAPLAGPARGYDVDRMDPDGRTSVPVAFHTDGSWIWPAAVNYYLREYDVPPEPDLVGHISRQRFEVPLVDDSTRAAAAAFLGPGPAAPPRPAGPPRPPAPGPTQAMPAPPGPGGPGPGGPGGRPAGPPPTTVAPPVTPPASAGSAPAAALPSPGPPGRTVDALRSRLGELGVPESAFRIGPPAGRAWTMEQTDEGWRVGWYDRAFVAPAMFEDVADAAAFLLGKLMMDREQGAGGPVHVMPAQRPTGDRLGGEDPRASGRPGEELAPPDYAPATDAGHRAPDGFGSGGGGFGTGGGFGMPDAAAAELSGPPGMPDYGPPDAEPDLARHSRHGLHDTEHANNGHHDNGRTSFARADAPGYQPESSFGQPELERTQFASPDLFRTDSPPSGFDRPDLSRTDSPPSGFDQPDPSRFGRPDPDPSRSEPRRGEQLTTVAPSVPGRTAAAPSGDWPISPLPGEPPLTLFRGKRLVELEPGTEIDRFGEDDGNLVYALGTPFKERSLVPEWVDRPYHTYRVQQPVQALTGAAIPWFDQPGGGTAYILPDAVGELVALGRLVEITGRDRPPA